MAEQSFYRIDLVPSAHVAFYIGTNEIPRALGRAFAGAKFNDNHDAGRPLAHTEQEVFSDTDGRLIHALAFDKDEQFSGAVFGIPAANHAQQEACDVGWMFTAPELAVSQRLIVLKGLLLATTMHLRAVGYRRIETRMGTVAGAGVLKRMGFYRNPQAADTNSWVFPIA